MMSEVQQQRKERCCCLPRHFYTGSTLQGYLELPAATRSCKCSSMCARQGSWLAQVFGCWGLGGWQTSQARMLVRLGWPVWTAARWVAGLTWYTAPDTLATKA